MNGSISAQTKNCQVGRPEGKQIPRPDLSGLANAARFGVVLMLMFLCPGARGDGATRVLQLRDGDKSSAPTSGAEAEAQKVRAEQYAIEVQFDPEKGWLHAKAAVTLAVEVKSDAIEFELNTRLHIVEVTDEEGRKLEFVRSGRIGSAKLSVRLAEAVPAGQGIKLTFVYQGTLPRGELDYITKDGILLRDESRWYPAVDLSAFTQNKFTVIVPVGWTAITSGGGGRLSASANRTIVSSGTSRPVSSRSLVAAPAASWRCRTGTGVAKPGSSEVQYSLDVCAPVADEMQQKGLLEHIQELLRKYTSALEAVPQTYVAVVTGFPGARGAVGYSAPGFLVVSEDVVKYHEHSGWAAEFLPHEIAHQWFPIEVTVARQEDGWLAESVAEYLAWRFLLEKEPEQARRMVLRAMRDALEPEPLPPLSLGLKLFREPWEVTHATLYQRGLLVWRTLETVIGRSRVDQALREYHKRFAGKSASIADFLKICEETSGRELGWFFKYFINGTQIPEISMRRLPSDAPNVLLGEIVVRNVPADFQVRMEMRMHTAAGPVDHSVATRGEVTPFSINLPSPATRVTLDPEQRVLRWTEAARRNKDQVNFFSQARELEQDGDYSGARANYLRALHADPDDTAGNRQMILFQLARLLYRQGKLAQARKEFQAVLEQNSLDTMDTDFYRAWAHVFRARAAKRTGQTTEAVKEAKAGLASGSPAMETKIAWPGERREQSAREALQVLAAR